MSAQQNLHLQGWTTRHIELHWRQPPPVGDGPYREVVVFELEATGQGGRRHTARAEVAPLPGLHRTTLDEAVAATAHWLETHQGRTLPRWEEFESEPLLCSLSGPARTGLEGALIELWASLHQVRPDILWGRILDTNPAGSIHLNALVSGSGDSLAEQVQRSLESGYRTIKLKVGRSTIDEDLHRTVAVDAVLASARRDGLPVSLRLDANRAWSLEQASLFAQGLGDRPIEYLEEPLVHAEDLEALHLRTGIPLAIDESAVGSPLSTWRHRPGIVALVLKPSVRKAGGTEGPGAEPAGEGAEELPVALVVDA
ncbi:MAG: enolase C-terminal domain-like protein, partial [Myxococcota bacterium]|nr:enolase C-terminal domain-like protein [Myxococcota bacterium]